MQQLHIDPPDKDVFQPCIRLPISIHSASLHQHIIHPSTHHSFIHPSSLHPPIIHLSTHHPSIHSSSFYPFIIIHPLVTHPSIFFIHQSFSTYIMIMLVPQSDERAPGRNTIPRLSQLHVLPTLPAVEGSGKVSYVHLFNTI